MESMEGWKIEVKTRYLGISHYIFITNYNQLKTSLELFNHKEVSSTIWAVKNRNKLNQFQIEVIRLFHNYLASVKSLVDHTRIVVEEVHGNKEFSREYELKKQEIFVNSPLSRFIQDLRNYILHKGIPKTIARKTFIESDKANSILLDINSLRSWDNWSAKSKEYLDNAKDNINLYELIVAYGSLVIDFYNWFLMKQEELYKEEFRKYDSIKREYNETVLRVFPYLRE
jgi:hypothetical protein